MVSNKTISSILLGSPTPTKSWAPLFLLFPFHDFFFFFKDPLGKEKHLSSSAGYISAHMFDFKLKMIRIGNLLILFPKNFYLFWYLCYAFGAI